MKVSPKTCSDSIRLKRSNGYRIGTKWFKHWLNNSSFIIRFLYFHISIMYLLSSTCIRKSICVYFYVSIRYILMAPWRGTPAKRACAEVYQHETAITLHFDKIQICGLRYMNIVMTRFGRCFRSLVLFASSSKHKQIIHFNTQSKVKHANTSWVPMCGPLHVEHMEHV